MARQKGLGENGLKRLIKWIKQYMGTVSRVEWDDNEKKLYYQDRNSDTQTMVNIKEKILNLAYPVGTIYISTTDVNPSTFLGGSWAYIKDRFLIGAGNDYTVKQQGGVTEITIERKHLPKFNWYTESGGAHGHYLVCEYGMSAGLTHNPNQLNYMQPANSSAGTRYESSSPVVWSGSHSHTFYMNPNTDQSNINILPPYYGAFIFERIA